MGSRSNPSNPDTACANKPRTETFRRANTRGGKTGILVIGYNRPDNFRRVLGSVEKNSNFELFISIDGPKCAEDALEVNRVKSIAQNWPTNRSVRLRFLSQNVGCKEAVEGAIDWAFEAVDKLIILEDDCLPSPDFFDFMDWGLETFEDVPEVAMVSGWNELGVWPRYRPRRKYLVTLGGIWGWATWRDRWNEHRDSWNEPNFAWKSELNNARREMRLPRVTFKSLEAGLEQVFDSSVDTWDYQWAFTRVRTRSFSINPRFNLVTNIGFSHNSTHFSSEQPLMPVGRKFNIFHQGHRTPLPSKITVSKSYVWGQLFLGRSRKFVKRVRKLRRRLWNIASQVTHRCTSWRD